MIRAINRAGAFAAALGLRRPELDVEQMLESACEKTGLSDFGEMDFREGLEELVASIRDEAQLSQIGRVAAKKLLLDELEKRLQVIDYRKQRPEVAEGKIERPLFIVGLPRTGTTILHEILAQDPSHRSPLTWEVSRPCPPANDATLHNDRRIAEVDAGIEQTDILAPGFRAIHAMGALLPQECVALWSSNFASDQFAVPYRIPTYRRWLQGCDMSATYEWHYRFLQHLQVNCQRERWVLKTPVHLYCLDKLVQRYPDAAIVQTHRDPMAVMGSVSSLACTLRSAFSDHIDPVQTAAEETEHFSTYLGMGLQQRRTMADEKQRFFDFYFDDLIHRPLPTIRKLYEHFGFELSDEAAKKMQRYIDNRPRNKHGTHAYKLAAFGLSRAQHGELFQEYCDYFNIEEPTS